MRVLHFFKTYFPDNCGGIERVINQISRGSINHGIKTDVLCLTENKHNTVIELDGHKIHRAKQNFHIASTGISLSVFSLFSKLAKEADIIHYHFPWPMMDIVHFLTRHNKPTVLTYHSDIIKQRQLLRLYRPLKNHFLSSVDSIVATSQNYLNSSNVLMRFKDKVEIIPIGLEKEAYPSIEISRVNTWRPLVGSKFFLFIGVLRYYKGLHILIEASRTAKYPIVIVGAGPIEQELKQKIDSYGLKNFIFLGFIPEEDKVALLSLCYSIVFPSHLRSEAFGVSLLEGAMYGKPMISSEIGTGTSFINISNETGLVIPPNDPYALSQAMKWLWNHPIDAAAMGVKAEQRYWRLFTSDKMVNKYVDIYQRLTHKKNGT